MCLNIATEITAPLTGFGYKILNSKNDNYWFPRHKSIQTLTVVRRSHYPKIINIDYSHQNYPAGIHIFPTLADLDTWIGPMNSRYGSTANIWKVRYSGLVAQGIDKGADVLVVQQVEYIELCA